MSDKEIPEISCDIENDLIEIKIGKDIFQLNPTDALFMAQLLIEKSLLIISEIDIGE